MDVVVVQGTASGGGSGGAPIIRTTTPPEVLRHNISHEQLVMLADLKRDGISGLAWASLGIAGGAFPGTAEALIKAYFTVPAAALTPLGLANVALFLVGAAICAVCFIVAASRGQRAKTIFEEIASQPVSRT